MKPIHYLYMTFGSYGEVLGYYTPCKINPYSNDVSSVVEDTTCKNCLKTKKFKSDNYV